MLTPNQRAKESFDRGVLVREDWGQGNRDWVLETEDWEIENGEWRMENGERKAPPFLHSPFSKT
jgi:hypothetical protein